MSASDAVRLTDSMLPGNEERAVRVLRRYYGPLAGAGSGFTGGRFDAFDPSASRSASTNTFTSDDLVAVGLLSVEIPPRAAYELLVGRRREFEVHLEELGPDRDFADLTSVDRESFAPAWDLWQALKSLPGLGPTKVSKLMARKRPKLIPIFDDVVDQKVFGGARNQWVPLHHSLRSPCPGSDEQDLLRHRLDALRASAGLGPEISTIRVFDVLAWMDGSGNHGEGEA